MPISQAWNRYSAKSRSLGWLNRKIEFKSFHIATSFPPFSNKIQNIVLWLDSVLFFYHKGNFTVILIMPFS